MELITNRREVIQNVYQLYSYTIDKEEAKKDFAKNLLKAGWVFVAEKIAGKIYEPVNRISGYALLQGSKLISN